MRLTANEPLLLFLLSGAFFNGGVFAFTGFFSLHGICVKAVMYELKKELG
jgi:hypothetical protein